MDRRDDLQLATPAPEATQTVKPADCRQEVLLSTRITKVMSGLGMERASVCSPARVETKQVRMDKRNPSEEFARTADWQRKLNRDLSPDGIAADDAPNTWWYLSHRIQTCPWCSAGQLDRLHLQFPANNILDGGGRVPDLWFRHGTYAKVIE
jgi:hypothetical protein